MHLGTINEPALIKSISPLRYIALKILIVAKTGKRILLYPF